MKVVVLSREVSPSAGVGGSGSHLSIFTMVSDFTSYQARDLFPGVDLEDLTPEDVSTSSSNLYLDFMQSNPALNGQGAYLPYKDCSRS